MLMKTLLETYRDVSRQLMSGQNVTPVAESRQTANSSHWANDVAQASRLRRQRRQRRLDRAVRHSVNGWSVRTW